MKSFRNSYAAYCFLHFLALFQQVWHCLQLRDCTSGMLRDCLSPVRASLPITVLNCPNFSCWCSCFASVAKCPVVMLEKRERKKNLTPSDIAAAVNGESSTLSILGRSYLLKLCFLPFFFFG